MFEKILQNNNNDKEIIKNVSNYMKNFIAIQVISMLVSLRHLRLKLLKDTS